MQKRIEVFSKHEELQTRESVKCLEYFAAHGGGIDLRDPQLFAAPALPEYRYWEQVKAGALALPPA